MAVAINCRQASGTADGQLLIAHCEIKHMHDCLGRYSEKVYVVMRVAVAFIFACHGAQKYFGVLGGTVQIHTAKGLIAGTIELIGGTMIALGVFTPIVAFIASGEMAVAFFWVHAKRGFWPILNHGELPVVLCFIFLYVAARGSGRYSLDYLLRHRGPRAGAGEPVG